MNLEVTFQNKQQREFYYATERNQCFSGGFNNGKTYSGCLKAVTLLNTFSNYRMIIARQTLTDLKKTTMETFFKVCPKELIDSHNQQDGFTRLKNRSLVNWMHLDNVDESSLRGNEPNSVLVDQAEETDEKVYDVLDARVGRWDDAVIPPNLLESYPNWPRNKQGKHIAPSYNMLLCNPDTQYHYIYRKYHPDSLERRPNHFFTEGEWDPNLGSEETYQQALLKGGEYVEKYVRGKWGVSNAQIHRLFTDSLLDYSDELFARILKKGNLFRVLDHGDASPTCCLWFAVLDNNYICYREYYVPNQVISYHRKAISELSEGETYTANYADPSIFYKQSQKNNGFWTVADEYMDRSIDSPPLYWIGADNNEFATRNRINEFLGISKLYKQPISNVSPAPRLYFIKRSNDYPNGCYYAINELQAQRRKLIGYADGKAQYCDDREEKISDHAYDPIRYFIAMHSMGKNAPQRPIKQNTIAYFKMMKKRQTTLEALSA